MKITPSQPFLKIFYGVHGADYQAINAGHPPGDPARIMSRSDLMAFAKNPRKWLSGYTEDDTKSTLWGDLIDCHLTGAAGDFEARYAICPPTYTAKGKKKDDPDVQKPWNRNADACRDWEDARSAEGKTCLKVGDKTEAEKAVQRIMQEDEAANIIEHSEHQALVLADYQEPISGMIIPVRLLIDFVLSPESDYPSALADLKTTKSAELRAWRDSVGRFDYDAQAAMQIDVWNAVTGESRNTFYHVCQENEPPYEPQVWMLSEDFITIGRVKYQEALRRYAECQTTKRWPGYGTASRMQFGRIGLCEPSPWQIKDLSEV